MNRIAIPASLSILALTPLIAQAQQPAAAPVTVDNFIRAETDVYFGNMVREGGFGKFHHLRELAPVDNQLVIRQNRDTLYSAGVFDLDAGDVKITMPDAGSRFMSMQVISEDHYTTAVNYRPGVYKLTRDQIGTRYIMAAI